MTAPAGPGEPQDAARPTDPAPGEVGRDRSPETTPSVHRTPHSDATAGAGTTLGADPTPGAAARPPVLLQVRPRRITILAIVAAVVVVAAMIIVSVLLLQSEEGVSFRVSDQIGIIGIGLVLAGLILTAARPRLRVDATGVRVRNVLAEQFVPWSLILRIGYPQGSPWAQLVMPDDEVKPVMAIQAMDRARAVQALERVRALQAQYGPPPPRPQSPGPKPEDDLARPLGRLEIIDREKAAARDRDAAAKRARGKGSTGR